MTTPRNYPDYLPYGINLRVPNMEYAADVNAGGAPYFYFLGAPLAKSATVLGNAIAMVNGSAVTASVANGAILNGGLVPNLDASKPKGFGRGIVLVASAANTRTATITGYDYLGQKTVEVVTMNGATPVPSVKAYLWLDNIVFSSAADVTTVNVGTNDLFGFPYAANAMISEMKNGAPAANAGTFVAALADGTAAANNNADVRGTYAPSTVVPNGTNTFELVLALRRGNLHGNAQAAS